MRTNKKISYQGVNPHTQPMCCFFSNSIAQQRSNQFNKKTQKYYIHNPQKNHDLIKQEDKEEDKEEVRSRRSTFSTLKKSLSGINLKRKNSQNQKTNRTFYQNTEISQNFNKRFVTTSMDAQVFKQYFPSSQNQHRKRSAFLSPSESYQKLNKNQQSLQSLFRQNQKKKNAQNMQKQIKKQNKKIFSYLTNEISSTKATLAVHEAQNEHLKRNQDKKQNQRHIPSFLKQLKQRKYLHQQKQSIIEQDKSKKKLSMNQIQSILISVPSNQKKNLNTAAHLKKFSKQVLQNITVNSEYQPDQEEKKQRVQQSTILVNYFNPPSFIKQKCISKMDKSKAEIQNAKIIKERMKYPRD